MRFVLAKVVFFAGETHVRPYELRVNIVKTNQRIVCVTCEIEEYAMYKRLQSNGDGTRHPRAPRARATAGEFALGVAYRDRASRSTELTCTR